MCINYNSLQKLSTVNTYYTLNTINITTVYKTTFFNYARVCVRLCQRLRATIQKVFTPLGGQTVFVFSRGCVYVCLMNAEIVITLICLSVGLFLRPWRFKENRNSDGKLSTVAIIGWVLIVVGGLLLISVINRSAGLSLGIVLGWLLGLFLTVMLGYELLLFSRKYTIQQVLFGGGILIIGVALSLLGISVNEQTVLLCIILLTACLVALLLLRLFSK